MIYVEQKRGAEYRVSVWVYDKRLCVTALLPFMFFSL